jgi:dTDP-4-amino-4,6-dideoxygalactose transaminase
MKVPFSNLPGQYRALATEIDREIKAVLESGSYVLGPQLAELEKEFAASTGCPHGVGVNSGTSALHLALLAAGVKPGDEVITVPMTFVATIAAIEYAQAVPRFVDIDPVHHTMDVSKLEAAISGKTKVILPVHLHGQACDMAPILEIATRRGLTVIEDAAQAHGGFYGGKALGTLGRMGCFSFYPGKNLGACGEAGMVLCQSAEDEAEIKLLRNWGSREKYLHEKRGFNYRLDSIQSAILRVKLRSLESWARRRHEMASLYLALLKSASLLLPTERPGSIHAYHVFAVRIQQRDSVAAQLRQRGIETGIHYPLPVHLQPAYRDLGYGKGRFPVSEQMARETLSLPIYPEMSDGQVEYVAQSLMEILEQS